MFEMFGQSWQCIVVMFAIPVAIAVYFSMRFRAGPLTNAMRAMDESVKDAGQDNVETNR